MTTNDILLLSLGNSNKALLEVWGRYSFLTTNAKNRFSFNQYKDKINQMIGTLKDMEIIINDKMDAIKKEPLLFISHASKNRTFVNALVDLLVFLRFDTNNLFCSSKPGYGIPVGEDLYGFLRSRFVDYDIFVIFVHSKEYYESHVCLNEMGAAWAFQSKHASILLPGFDFKDMDGAVNNKEIAIKIDDDKAWCGINSLKDQLISFFLLREPNASAWEEARNHFFDSIKNNK